MSADELCRKMKQLAESRPELAPVLPLLERGIAEPGTQASRVALLLLLAAAGAWETELISRGSPGVAATFDSIRADAIAAQKAMET